MARRPLAALLVVAAIGSLSLVLWQAAVRNQPRYYLRLQAQAAIAQQENERRQALDRLVALGPPAVDPVIGEILDRTPWTEETDLLPAALGRIGDAARRRLLDRIAGARNGRERLILVWTLQQGFSDFSHLEDWLNGMQARPTWGMAAAHRLGPQLEDKIGGVPGPMFRGGSSPGFTPAFVAWYTRHTPPRGPLPPYRFWRIAPPTPRTRVATAAPAASAGSARRAA